MRYHSFLSYFRLLKALGWVERTGQTEHSEFQDSYPPGPPRVFYRLTVAGKGATMDDLSDPIVTLYGYPPEKRSPKTRKYVQPPPAPGHARARARTPAGQPQ